MARRQKPAKVVTTGSRPTAAMPPAAAIMFCSAMPNCTKRAGWDLRIWCTRVPPAMSASSTTSLGNSSASDDSVLPKASRSESPLLAIRAGLDIEQFLDFIGAAAQRLQRFQRLFARHLHAAVPGGDVFHVRHTLALDGMGDDHRWRALGDGGAAEGVQDGGNVMAVYFGDGPAKGAPLRGQRLQ